jgi:hypothetical protein
LVPNLAFGGQINKCADAEGKVTYSDKPCPAASSNKEQVKPPSAPDPYEVRKSQLELKRMELQSIRADTNRRFDQIDRDHNRRVREIDEEYCHNMAKIYNDYTSNDLWERRKTEANRKRYEESCLSK